VEKRYGGEAAERSAPRFISGMERLAQTETLETAIGGFPSFLLRR